MYECRWSGWRYWQPMRQFQETSQFLSTQLKTPRPFWGKVSYLLLQETYLILPAKPIYSYSLFPHRRLPEPALNELHDWRNVWLCMNKQKQGQKLLTEESFWTQEFMRGVLAKQRRDTINRDIPTHSHAYIHTHAHIHAYLQPCLHTRTCTHNKAGGGSPWGK